MKEILKNSDVVIGEEQLLERLKNNEKLKVKFGVDPTRPDLTLGHMVVFNKLRQFQELGHEAILLIGDYTAQIGDPSGRSSLRPILTEKEISINASTYLDQAFKILDETKTTVRRNSEWFNPMAFADCLKLARSMTVARMLERDDFSKRYSDNIPISIVEFLYPLIQGYDSVVLEADVELGGSDQLFNMLVGRTLQKEKDLFQQTVITLPLLRGLDGRKKMSKSFNNYISFNDLPNDIYGKVMSITDDMMWDYFKLLLMYSDSEIAELQSMHPKESKMKLALELTSIFHGSDQALYEQNQFNKVFAENKNPDSLPLFHWNRITDQRELIVLDIINSTNKFQSKSEIRRLIKQGGLKVNAKTISDPFKVIAKPDDELIFKVGKKFFFKLIP